jgi:hypothetical protein
MGRSSVDATKASLILWARAARCLLVAGLTCFLCPRGVVAFFVAAAVDFFDDVVVFFAGDFDAAVLGVPCFFFADVDWVVDAPEALGAVSSLLIPSAEAAAVNVQRTAASTRVRMVAEGREKTDCIFPM